MWYQNSIFYQIYPFGFCGAPQHNDGILHNRIVKVAQWIPHMLSLGIDTVLFNPVFESDAHGYDTRDMQKLDVRLGSNEDFSKLCRQLHNSGLRIILDGVFNHVGRGFWAFLDVQQNRENSEYRDWFHIDFSRDSNYQDGFWYEGWEGHYELVKLNLNNPQVVDYLLESVGKWMDEFDIDGIRLDVAYCLQADFMRRLREFTSERKPEFFMVGEVLSGDYKTIIQPDMLHSATNYECYKGIYSSFNSLNMFEIAHSLNRQFGPEDWTLYKGLPLLNFVDNHDVSRIASILSNPAHLTGVYGLLFGMPGIPCVYYGSEWGALGDKKQGDGALRACYDVPVDNDCSETVARMAKARKSSPALCYGDYRQVYLTNRQFIFERRTQNQRVLVAINAEDTQHTAHFDARSGMALDLLQNAKVDFGGGLEMAPYSVQYLEMEYT